MGILTAEERQIMIRVMEARGFTIEFQNGFMIIKNGDRVISVTEEWKVKEVFRI